MEEKEIGFVSHYFTSIGVVAIKITAEVLNVGDTIHIKGHTTEVTQAVSSMQIEHNAVQQAKKGDSVGMKIDGRVRKGDIIYKVIP